MARSSRVDAVEKFRFSVSVLNVSLDPVTLVQNFSTFLRAGFAEVTLPKRAVTVMEYRENIDAAHMFYSPGITRFEPITLRRGVTQSSDFYRWITDVHDVDVQPTTGIMRGRSDPSEGPPADSLNYRKDVLITVYGRGGALPAPVIPGNYLGINRMENVVGAAGASLFGVGDVIKAWQLHNAWVSSYSPGDTLSAKEDSTKLIEEVELRYDSYEEISIETLAKRIIGNIF
jgi:phage tail-like protein